MQDEEQHVTRGGRLGTMLIVASLIAPPVALAGMLALRHYFLVHYTAHGLRLWLLLDALILAAGLIVRENDQVTSQPSSRRRIR